MEQLVSLVGALLILGGFAGSALGWLTAKSRPYLTLNLIGSALLGWVAIAEGQAGFIVLEGTWAVISFIALARTWVVRRQ